MNGTKKKTKWLDGWNIVWLNKWMHAWPREYVMGHFLKTRSQHNMHFNSLEEANWAGGAPKKRCRERERQRPQLSNITLRCQTLCHFAKQSLQRPYVHTDYQQLIGNMADFSWEDRGSEVTIYVQTPRAKERPVCRGKQPCSDVWKEWEAGHSHLNYLSAIPNINCSPHSNSHVYSNSSFVRAKAFNRLTEEESEQAVNTVYGHVCFDWVTLGKCIATTLYNNVEVGLLNRSFCWIF